ncbi:MAG TPA: hypothetical protein VFV79_10465, partial [Saprospiraceae bacterium]|nr:hypothetical protein [Saprospiraceae bacterium]
MDTIRFGVIGAGGFAQFAVAQFIKVPGCRLTGVYDENIANARALRDIQPDAGIFQSAEALC